MAPKKITFKNDTPDTIIFRHMCKSLTLLKITLQPGEVRDIGPNVNQTSETYWLQDSSGNSTGQFFSTDEVDDFTGGNVTKQDDGSYVLTKVPRPTSVSFTNKLRKWWSGNQDSLPTSSGSHA